MCRWLAYSGNPVCLEDMLFNAKHSLIDQSMSSRSAETPTNGDGFGIGWYVKGMQKPKSEGTTGLYGYGHMHGHMGAVSLTDPRAERMHEGYSQVVIPGQRAMGLGAAYASIPGMAHFPSHSARAGYRNAMGY